MAVNAACPSCNSRDVRVSQARSFVESLLELVGVYQVRCKQCRCRFRRSVWQPANFVYARCPRCYRMELSTWSAQYYNPPASTVMKLRLGATPYRCEYCRCNFASWRACKERFLWRNHRKHSPVPVPPGLDRALNSSGSEPESSEQMTAEA